MPLAAERQDRQEHNGGLAVADLNDRERLQKLAARLPEQNDDSPGATNRQVGEAIVIEVGREDGCGQRQIDAGVRQLCRRRFFPVAYERVRQQLRLRAARASANAPRHGESRVMSAALRP